MNYDAREKRCRVEGRGERLFRAMTTIFGDWLFGASHHFHVNCDFQIIFVECPIHKILGKRCRATYSAVVISPYRSNDCTAPTNLPAILHLPYHLFCYAFADGRLIILHYLGPSACPVRKQ